MSTHTGGVARRSRNRLLNGVMVAAIALGFALPASAEQVLRIAMTAADVPLTTGAPDEGYEGIRFLGYPIFEGLVLWDMRQDETLADITPGLAESWHQDPDEPRRWIFELRQGVQFHDGSAFDADAAIWNLERYYDADSPQFDPSGGAVAQARNPFVESFSKIDDYTIEITTPRPLSYFPYMLTYMLYSSPARFEEAGGEWGEFARNPSGTGPFQITEFVPRERVELTRFDDYWDEERIARLDRMILYPMPEPTTRLAALRSGQVDWIELPPPDAIPSLEAAGFQISSGSYPHVWPWVLNLAKEDAPWDDVRVRRAVNYCMDREGIVTLLNGMAEPAYGIFKPEDPYFGEPKEHYTFDPDQARELLSESGYGPDNRVQGTIMITAGGSGQMLPLPMNEVLQQALTDCWFDIAFEQVEWGTMLVALRNHPTAHQAYGVDAMNMSLPPSTDVSQMALYFHGGNLAPGGRNWSHWQNEEFDRLIEEIEVATDEEEILEKAQQAHAILVDDAPWAFIVHDVQPRAMAPNVKGFIVAQSWFKDFTTVHLED
jgi:peptide/nickel transport system substrate-binding protein